MTHGVVVALAVAAVAAQVLVGLFAVSGVLALLGVGAPFRIVRRLLWGYELWAAFLVAAVATGGSLFYSEVAGFVPCELCWYQRICAYPLSIVLLLAALANDHRVARYLLPLPVAGAGVAIYHLLIEHGVLSQSRACFLSAPGGCATRWTEEFGYLTIPAVALSGFALLFALLLLSVFGGDEQLP